MDDYWAFYFLIGCIRAWDADPMWKGYYTPEDIEATFTLWKWLHQ